MKFACMYLCSRNPPFAPRRSNRVKLPKFVMTSAGRNVTQIFPPSVLQRKLAGIFPDNGLRRRPLNRADSTFSDSSLGKKPWKLTGNGRKKQIGHGFIRKRHTITVCTAQVFIRQHHSAI
ncbi:Hypothetical protein NTJ_16102 [Nesidiocoris tenuis]|uniref:39S ribosomal protein L34, mitochondrial n=1 Tax=Nesidiocoris tenuis TaxID=355587 RepID=A0ABN7BIT9_9HEMI|nr:Hypothetical protein NTJ_16102 [Nesidiocoris tenuis]